VFVLFYLLWGSSVLVAVACAGNELRSAVAVVVMGDVFGVAVFWAGFQSPCDSCVAGALLRGVWRDTHLIASGSVAVGALHLIGPLKIAGNRVRAVAVAESTVSFFEGCVLGFRHGAGHVIVSSGFGPGMIVYAGSGYKVCVSGQRGEKVKGCCGGYAFPSALAMVGSCIMASNPLTASPRV